MSFFLENDSFYSHPTTTMRGLVESVDNDILNLNENVYQAEISYKDALIESMQQEAGYILYEADEKGKGIGATIKSWFMKIYEMFKKLFNKIKSFFVDTFNKMFSIAHKLENYYKKNKNDIAKAGSAEVSGLSRTQRGDAVIARGKTYIKDAVTMAMQSLKMSSKKEGFDKAVEGLKVDRKDDKTYTIKSEQVAAVAGEAKTMVSNLKKSQEAVLKSIANARDFAKDAVQRAQKADDKNDLQRRKEELTLENQRVNSSNKVLSAGIRLCNALMSDAFKSAKALVKKARSND